jgi:hypothetical protein
MFSTSHLRLGGAVLAAAGLAVSVLAAVSAATSAQQLPARAGAHRALSADAARSACAGPQNAPCTTIVRAEDAPRTGVQATPPNGYAPADLQSAYNLTAASAADGTGATVAVIGTYDDPTAASDLSVYRAQYGLPSCSTTTGCFTQLNEDGQASPPAPTLPADDDSYLTSQAIDTDMVSAVCPNCKILLLEANNTDITDMGTAVESAVTLGAQYVIVGWSNYGGANYATSVEPDFDHPGVAITAPAGDTGYVSSPVYAYYPGALQYVTAVGGTTLTPAPGTARGWSETAWGPAAENQGTASGCDEYDPKPSWQTDTGCAYRTYNDVSAVADPNTGVAFYSTQGSSGWEVAGGTTVSAAIVGAVYALAGPPAANTFPVSYPWLDSADLYNVTSGNNFDGGTCTPAYLCNAGAGYNAPTGWGTPDGTGGFTLGSTSGNLVSVINPGARTTGAAEPVSVPVTALDSAAGQTLTYAASGLPAGLSINSATGVITGTPPTDALSDVTVTASDSTGAHASVSFQWKIDSAVVLLNPGRQQTEPDSAASLQISASDLNSPLTPTLTYSASGLPPGLSINSATGLISGTTTSGIASSDVTITVADTAGASSSVSFTWVVENLIKVSVQGLTEDEEQVYYDVPVSVQVSATDSAAGLPLTFSATGLPPGLSINSQTGLITGTPTAAGAYFAAITVSDGTGSTGAAGPPGSNTIWGVAGFSSVVNPGPLTNAIGSVAALHVGLTNLAPGDPVLYQVTGLPPGLSAPDQNESVSPASLVISGYPSAAGTYQLTLSVWDDYGALSTVSFTWTVTPRAYHWSRAPHPRLTR